MSVDAMLIAINELHDALGGDTKIRDVWVAYDGVIFILKDRRHIKWSLSDGSLKVRSSDDWTTAEWIELA